jgi:hypothetical protein
MSMKNRVFESHFTACLLLFAAALPSAAQSPPTFTAIDPATGVRGTLVSVTLTGTNFSEPMTIAATGITVTNIQVVNANTATADFNIDSGTPLGVRTIFVTTPGGTVGGVRFTIVPPAPTFSGIDPTFGIQGTTMGVTLTGTNFVTGLTINGGTDITARSISIISPTRATATLAIAAGSALGAHDLTVTTSGGTSEVVSFVVVAPPAPTLTSISPQGGIQDSTISVSLKGTNFLAGLTISGPGDITIADVNVVDSTTATATFKIAATAELGPHDITITTLGGTTAAVPFATLVVSAVPPALTGVAPASGSQGATVQVTLTGTNFSSGLSVNAADGITVSNVSVTNGSTATATLTIDSAAGLGSHSISVATPGGVSGTVSFRVDLPAPTLTGINPAQATAGDSPDVELSGTNFMAGLSIDAGANIAVSNVVIVDSTLLRAKFTIGTDASPGNRSVTVTTATGSASVTFTVFPLPPTLTSITPASFVQRNVAQSVSVTLTGTNFYSPSLAITGSGVSLSGARTTSSTSATAVITVAANADLGAREVTLTTLGGTTAPVTFTVVAAIPEITKVDPAIAARGASVTVTLTGQYFVPGATTVAGIPGIEISDLAVQGTTSATATFTVSPSASIGAREIRLTTPSGTSAPATFMVADPFPDVAISSSHAGNFGVGFDEVYTVQITNRGTLPTTGTITVTDVLPVGFTFVSGVGPGWTCSSTGATLTCSNGDVLQPSSFSSYVLKVRVGSDAASVVNHRVSVVATGDLNAANDSANEVTNVIATPSPAMTFNPSSLVAGEQATVAVTLPTSFPHDVTGAVSMTFSSNAVIPLDDPAIQFATGGRSANFTIPANTTMAVFDSQSQAGPLAFQTGTVAGNFTFAGKLTAGSIQSNFSPSASVAGGLKIPLQAPVIDSIETSNQNGLVVSITLSSTPREVTQLTLTFKTNPKVSLSCAAASGCSASGQTLVLDVQPVFTEWFTSDSVYGSLSMLHVPLSITGGKLKGTIDVTLSNNSGVSNSKSFNPQ